MLIGIRLLLAIVLVMLYLVAAISFRQNPYGTAYLVSGVAILALGSYVLFKNSRENLNRSFFLLCLALGAYMFAVYVAHLGVVWGESWVIWGVWLLRNGNLLLPASFMYFLYQFSRPKSRFLRAMAWFSLISMLPFVVLNALGMYVTEYKLAGRTYVPANALVLYKACGLVTTGWLVTWLVLILTRSFSAIGRHQRMQYLLILGGSALGIITGAVGFLPSFRDIWYPSIMGLAMFLFPLSLGLAVVRFNMFDVKLVIRRTLPYAVVTSIVGGLYALSLVSLGYLNAMLGGMPTGAELVVLIILVGLGFQPTLEYLQVFIDRLFFREEAKLDAFLAKAGSRYGTASSPSTLADFLAGDVNDSLHLEGAAVFLTSGEMVTIARAGEFPVIDDEMDQRPIPELGKTDPVLADENGQIDLGPAHTLESKALSNANIKAIIPFGSGNTLGVVLCKRKLSDLSFNTRDVTFLKAIATQMEIALGRVQATASADAAQRLTEAVFESMTNGVALVSGDGIVSSANRAFEDTFGTAKGRNLHDLGLPNLSVNELSTGPKEVESTHGVFLATARKLVNPGYGETHILVLTDITELRRLQELGRRQAALAEIGATVSSINHEISNIITPINHNMEKMMRLESMEEIKALAQKIGQRLGALDNLTRELREYYRDPTINPRSVLLRNSVEQILIDLSDTVGTEWVPPRMQGLDIQLRADSQKLRQVLLNLCKNAWEAMQDKREKEWSITADIHNGKALISVADSGAGVKPELLAHLYEPFFTTKKERGSGLGMAIVKRIVEAHGAEIDVESKEGVGTTIRLLWPIAEG